MKQDWIVEAGYIRSILVKFREGPEVEEGVNYVEGTILHQFIADSSLNQTLFEQDYYHMVELNLGKFSESLEIGSPTLKGRIYRNEILTYRRF